MRSSSAHIPDPPPASERPRPETPRARLLALVRRRRRLLLVIGVLLSLYTLLGFVVLPWVLHRQLEKRLTALLHRETTIARVRANPYALSVTIDGLQIKARDGGTLISWDRLYVNVGGWRILMREISLDLVQLVRPHVRIGMDKRGRLNVQDLIEENTSQTPEPPPPPAGKKKKPTLVFAVRDLEIQQAQVEFSDRSHPQPFSTTIGPFDIRLQEFRALPDSTSPYSFTGITESGETFSWAGNIETEPLRSSGTISFEGLRLSKYSPYYAQQVGFEIRDGRLAVKTGYALEWGPVQHVLRVSDGSVSLRSLVLGIPGTPQPRVEVPETTVGGISVDVVGGRAQVGSVVLRNGVVRARRNRDGRFDLERMEAPPSAPQATQAGTPVASRKNESPFHWAVEKVELAGWRVELQDELPSRPATFVLAPVDIRLETLADGAEQKSQLAASIGWGGKGKVGIEGPVKLFRPAADLSISVDGLELPPFDPYLDLYGKLAGHLGAGRLGLKGHVRFDGGAQRATWGFEAETRVDGLTLAESVRSEELVRWKELQISGIKAASDPLGFSIQSIRLVQPRFNLVVAEDGASNLDRLLRTPPPAPQTATPEQKPPPPASKQAPPPAPGPPQPPVSLTSFQIVRGSATFVDRSVAPPANVSVEDLDVRLRGLSNAVNARGQVTAKALFAGGPMEMTGTLSPRMVNDATDIKVTSRGVDLTQFSSYFGKYAGFAVDKGKLDLDCDYKVAKRKLAATNLIKADQFTWGEATHSKDATKFPVQFGLAVLKDKDGLVELDVPVKGNIDDPGFRLYKVVWKAIIDLLLKTVTSPFTILGKAFGGGTEKLDVIDFQPGSPDLTQGAEKSLQGVSRALASRPALHMDIEGTTDPAADVKALKVRELKRQAGAAKSGGKDNKGGKGGAAELTDEEYLRFLENRYRSVTPSASGAAPDPTTMENTVLAAQQLPPEALSSLQQQRSEAARARLITLGIDANRLSLARGGERAKKEAGARVYFTLK